MSRKSPMAANGALAMPSSSPWYTYGVPWCRCRTVASVLAEATWCTPSSPNRDTGRGWSWLLQYSEFQPRPASPGRQRRLQVGEVERAQVVLVRALVQPDVLELEDHVELVAFGLGEQDGLGDGDVRHLAHGQH